MPVETGCLRAAHLFESFGQKAQPAAATNSETNRDKPTTAEIEHAHIGVS
jgi:hypothetical protein